MLRFRKALATLAIAAGAIVAASETPADVSASTSLVFPHAIRIVAFGSSSTQGVGASRKDYAYPARLEVLLRRAVPDGTAIQVANRGIGGEDADDMAKRLDRDVIAAHPDLVVWQTGSNDPMRHVPIERFERETREGIATMRQAGIEVILMEPQWSPHLDRLPETNRFRDCVRRIGADMNVKVIRRWDLMHEWVRRGLITPSEMVSRDGLHMADKGYALLARWVASEVLKVKVFKAMPVDTTLAAI